MGDTSLMARRNDSISKKNGSSAQFTCPFFSGLQIYEFSPQPDGRFNYYLYFCLRRTHRIRIMEVNNKYIRFDWAVKRMLRDKANFAVLEGLITVLTGEKVTKSGSII